jgi:glutathione synthase/RimK-type ligase-like ATP-grasp enzyme
MKKIGILFGQENSFPQAFVDKVNSKIAAEYISDITAEFIAIDKVLQGESTDYAVIIDRISQDVPFYRAYLKNAAVSGTAVINNPFWWSADEKFFNNALMTKIGVQVPKTVLVPSNQMPPDTNSDSFRNLIYPLNWEAMFDYVGFPAYFKPFAGGGWKSVFKIDNADDFFNIYNSTGDLVMMLQEEIKFDEYYRCYSIDRKDILIMPYEPRNPFHERYIRDGVSLDTEKESMLKDIVLKINNALGYDFNTVELAVRDGIPYAIDFCNPAPDADINSVGKSNFEWVVEAAANMAISRAKNHKWDRNNLTWGDFIYSFANNKEITLGSFEKSLKPKRTTRKVLKSSTQENSPDVPKKRTKKS